jgi:hypothetical protein
MSDWASDSLSDRADALRSFQNGLSVNLIATPRSLFETCAFDEELVSVIERNRENAFDFLPVTQSTSSKDKTKSPIIGLIEIAQFNSTANPRGAVRDYMRPLSEKNLIGADASILKFVRGADHQQCRLIISDTEISGIVSLSDLQRLPVRAALFAMVTHLEIIMTENIRRAFDGSDGWLERLSSDRQLKVRDKVAAAKTNDAYVDMLLFTEFADKVTIIRKSPNFSSSRTSFRRELSRIQTLRNDLAHAKNYAENRDAASGVCITVRLIDSWSERLATRPS